jgi:hypothetical protein
MQIAGRRTFAAHWRVGTVRWLAGNRVAFIPGTNDDGDDGDVECGDRAMGSRTELIATTTQPARIMATTMVTRARGDA